MTKDHRQLQDATTPPAPLRGVLKVACPRCSAQPGEACKDKRGKDSAAHAARKRVASARSFAEQVEHAQRMLPGEVPEFVAVAAMLLRYSGQQPTVGSVRARLQATGRDRASLAAGISETA